LAPADKVGFVQGLNNSAMNFGMALAPWLFGVLADATTTSVAIWTGIGISSLGANQRTTHAKTRFWALEKKATDEQAPLAW